VPNKKSRFIKMKPYNDKLTVVSTHNSVAAKIWAKSLLKETLKQSIWHNKLSEEANQSSITPSFTKKSIHQWWRYRKYNQNNSSIYIKTRQQAKNELSAWYGTKLDEYMFNALFKKELPNVGKTSNTKQTSNDWSCGS